MNIEQGKFEGWVILELMGHRRIVGFLTEQEIGGQNFLRIDIPCDPPATQFYTAQAVYAITPTTKDMVLAMAKLFRPQPVSIWELPAPEPQRTEKELPF